MTNQHRKGHLEVDRLMRTNPPMDMAVAAALLQEAKEVMDQHGVVFFLRQGTCLGAIRDNSFIPWDDDLDIGSIEGLHGFNRRVIDPVVDTFRDRGFEISQADVDGDMWIGATKDYVRIDWTIYRIRHLHIVHYPSVRIPVRFFIDLKEINFIGKRYLVPNPPEEYLAYKYGPEWMVPKQAGYAKDVVENVPAGSMPGNPGKLMRFLMTSVLRWRVARLRVLDSVGEPIRGAEITIVGWGKYQTNRSGYARLYLPKDDIYALVIRQGDLEEVLYEEQMQPNKSYVYRPDPGMSEGRIFVLEEE